LNSLFALQLLPRFLPHQRYCWALWMARELGGAKFAQFFAALLVFWCRFI